MEKKNRSLMFGFEDMESQCASSLEFIDCKEEKISLSPSSVNEMELGETPHFKIKAEEEVNLNLMLESSRKKYLQQYDHFIEWQTVQNKPELSEEVVLSYFLELSEKYAPSTVWGIYSMVRSTLVAKQDVDISSYPKVLAHLKEQSNGYEPSKSKVFTGKQLREFLSNALDEDYLAMKVVTVLGVYGTCRGNEIHNISIGDIEDIPQIRVMKISIPETVKRVSRSFIIDKENYDILKKYLVLRPVHCPTTQFLLNYQKGKCTRQPIGKNKIAQFPKKIAEFLNLPEPHKYTGLSFRKMSATVSGSWKSSRLEQPYNDSSDSIYDDDNNLSEDKNIHEENIGVFYGPMCNNNFNNQPDTSKMCKPKPSVSGLINMNHSPVNDRINDSKTFNDEEFKQKEKVTEKESFEKKCEEEITDDSNPPEAKKFKIVEKSYFEKLTLPFSTENITQFMQINSQVKNPSNNNQTSPVYYFFNCTINNLHVDSKSIS